MTLLDVFKDLWDQENVNSRSRFPMSFLMRICIYPLILTVILITSKIDIDSSRAQTLINALAIFLGFLISSLIPFFETAVDLFNSNLTTARKNLNSKPSTPEPKVEVTAEEAELKQREEDKKKLLRIIFSNLMAAILLSLVCLVTLIVKSMMPNPSPAPFLCIGTYNFFYIALNAVIFFSSTSLVMIIFNIIKRTRSFITDDFNAKQETQPE